MSNSNPFANRTTYLDASIIQRPWLMSRDYDAYQKDKAKYLTLINSITINKAGLQLTEVTEDEWKENIDSADFGLWIPMENIIDTKTENRIKMLQAKGFDIPYDPVTKKFKAKTVRYQTEALANMRYGRIEIHKFGSDTTLIWPHINRKLRNTFSGIDDLMISFTTIITKETGTDGIYVFSDSSNPNFNKVIYYSRGNSQHIIEGKECWEKAQSAYGITLTNILDKCYTNLDVLMAPTDIETVENEIRSIGQRYIGYAAGAYDINNPNLLADDKADIMEKIKILDNLMVERNRATNLLSSEVEVDTIYFRADKIGGQVFNFDNN